MMNVPITLASMTMTLAIAVSNVAANPPVAVDPSDEVSQIPPMPMTPLPVNGLVFARPFELDEGYEFEWRADRPTVKAGWLLVLEVDPACVFPRQTEEPVLYVGDTTAERINLGHQSGRAIVLVPSDINESGRLSVDLSKSMMWFGSPQLPEQVDAATIARERQRAAASKIAAFSPEQVAAARHKAGESLHLADRTALRQVAAELIKIHSPQEAELANLILNEAKADQAAQGAQNN